VLKRAAAVFLDGYRVSLESKDPERTLHALEHMDLLEAPFAFEGAAMGFRIQDGDSPEAERSAAFVAAASPRWHPLIRLGVGCGVARLGLGPPALPLELDGFGFMTGVLGLGRRPVLEPISPHSARGRGRALWFTSGGDARACARAVRRAATGKPELWRGVATACTFAGDPKGEAAMLLELSGDHAAHVAAGAAAALALWTSLGDRPPHAVTSFAILGPRSTDAPVRQRA
jgi:hypothetical protein